MVKPPAVRVSSKRGSPGATTQRGGATDGFKQAAGGYGGGAAASSASPGPGGGRKGLPEIPSPEPAGKSSFGDPQLPNFGFRKLRPGAVPKVGGGRAAAGLKKSRDEGDNNTEQQPQGGGSRLPNLVGAGGAGGEFVAADSTVTTNATLGQQQQAAACGIVTRFAAKSKVGLIPMNPGKLNQDSHLEVEAFAGVANQFYFGVMDGHGYSGKEVSDFIRRRLPTSLAREVPAKNPKGLVVDPRAALTRAVLKTNQELLKVKETDTSFSGSTCLNVLVRGEMVYVANTGNSRAVMGRWRGNHAWEVVPLSVDQTPDREDERARILACKGRVQSFVGPDGVAVGPPRVWYQNQDLPGLAMSRSLGDSAAANCGVIPDPEVWQLCPKREDKFFLLATSGIWEFISSQEAVEIVGGFIGGHHRDHGGGDPATAACEALIAEAERRWKEEEEIIEDLTVTVVLLNATG